jgi:hypothetical protein
MRFLQSIFSVQLLPTAAVMMVATRWRLQGRTIFHNGTLQSQAALGGRCRAIQ